MEDECSTLSWEFYQEEGFEDIRNTLLYTTLELEATLVTAKEELTRKEYELSHLNDLLSRVIRERDEAKARCQKLMLEKLELQQDLQEQKNQQPKNQQILQNGDTISQLECNSATPPVAASSDCEESNNIVPPGGGPTIQAPPSMHVILDELAEKKPLPEKGKLLKAVIDAGPLLQTILLAGPLPQWQHPPPKLNSIEIPPVTISPSSSCLLPQDSCNTSPCFDKKRNLVITGTDCRSTDSKGRKMTAASKDGGSSPSQKTTTCPRSNLAANWV